MASICASEDDELKGTYTLILACKKPFRTVIGRLGRVNVGKGHYLYTGSALGQGGVSLEGRLGRHLRASKKRQWHIDYLTASRNCAVRVVIFVKSNKYLECSVNQAIMSRLSVKPLLPRAGSSDCHCEAHITKVMARLPEKQILRVLTAIYCLFGRPVRFSPKRRH